MRDALDGRPELMKELEAILHEAGLVPPVTQTLIDNTGNAAQTVGNGTKVTRRR